MRALMGDRENLRALAHQHQLFAAGMAQKRDILLKAGQCDAGCEIGSLPCIGVIAHAGILSAWGGKSIAAGRRFPLPDREALTMMGSGKEADDGGQCGA
jgi:hypothetical protein